MKHLASLVMLLSMLLSARNYHARIVKGDIAIPLLQDLDVFQGLTQNQQNRERDSIVPTTLILQLAGSRALCCIFQRCFVSPRRKAPTESRPRP